MHATPTGQPDRLDSAIAIHAATRHGTRHRCGPVQDAAARPGAVTVTVGSANTHATYTVEFRLHPFHQHDGTVTDVLRVTCTCPVGGHCKHADKAARWWAAHNLQVRYLPRSQPNPSSFTGPLPERLASLAADHRLDQVLSTICDTAAGRRIVADAVRRTAGPHAAIDLEHALTQVASVFHPSSDPTTAIGVHRGRHLVDAGCPISARALHQIDTARRSLTWVPALGAAGHPNSGDLLTELWATYMQAVTVGNPWSPAHTVAAGRVLRCWTDAPLRSGDLEALAASGRIDTRTVTTIASHDPEFGWALASLMLRPGQRLSNPFTAHQCRRLCQTWTGQPARWEPVYSHLASRHPVRVRQPFATLAARTYPHLPDIAARLVTLLRIT